MAVVVIGGTVLDIQAQPSADDLRRGSSVPGRVVQLPGGVGRNIAEASHHLLQQLEQQQQLERQQQQQQPQCQKGGVLLVSVLGHDAAADALLASFRQLGMCQDGLLRIATASTPCVVALLDRAGEVAASVADVAAAQALTPAVVQQHAGSIAAAQVLVLDANLQAPTLQAAVAAAAAAGVPVLFEPVSVPKAPRCVPFLSSLSAITPNSQELLAIADAVQQQQGLPLLPRPAAATAVDGAAAAALPQQLLAQLAPAAAVVLQQGLACIILTMGGMGAALLMLCQQHHQQYPQQHVRSLQQQQHVPFLQQQCQQQQQQLMESRGSLGLGTAAATLFGNQQQQHKLGMQLSRDSSNGAATAVGRPCLCAWHIPAAPAAVVNLSGAGDTLTGGFAAALARGADPGLALALGAAAAAVSVGCELNVPGPQQGLLLPELLGVAQELLEKQQVWVFPVQAGL